MNILLTGGNGFIGRALYPGLMEKEHTVTCMIRKPGTHSSDPERLFNKVVYFDNLNEETEFKVIMSGIDVVVHLAARAHMLLKSEYDMQKEFMDINFLGTRNLAEQAAEQGVKRFVFISSIGVNGKSTKDRGPYTEQDIEKPYNSYTTSKLFAEKALRKIEAETGMEVVIIRPPLVYGPHVKANFLKLLNLVHSGAPLPLARVNNQRSFISINNLVDAICECAVHPAAAGETFLVSDGPPLSTTRLLEKIFEAFDRPPKLFFFPEKIFKIGLMLMRKKNIYDRLWGSLAVDSSWIGKRIGWQPEQTFEQEIKRTVQWYLKGYLKEKDPAHDSSR